MNIQIERASNGYFVSVDGESVITESGCEALWIVGCACGIDCTIDNGGTKYTCTTRRQNERL